MKLQKEYSENFMRSAWAFGKPIKLSGEEEFLMHKMSYGDYFAEPKGWTGGERDGFAPETIWFEKFVRNNKVFYKINLLLSGLDKYTELA